MYVVLDKYSIGDCVRGPSQFSTFILFIPTFKHYKHFIRYKAYKCYTMTPKTVAISSFR